MEFGLESLFERSKMLLDYVTHYYGYNAFIIDDIDDNLVRQLSKAIQDGNKVDAIRIYFKLDAQIDSLRDKYCYNVLPYRASFRGIAKDLYQELKRNWLIYHDDFKYIARILRFISTSDYYVIREYLMKRSHSIFNYKDIYLDPDSFYCGYIPLEAIMWYSIQLYRNYCKED